MDTPSHHDTSSMDIIPTEQQHKVAPKKKKKGKKKIKSQAEIEAELKQRIEARACALKLTEPQIQKASK